MAYICFLLCIKTIESYLAWFWTKCSHYAWFQCVVCIFSIHSNCGCTTPFITFFLDNVGLGHRGIKVACKKTWAFPHFLVDSLVRGWFHMLYLSRVTIVLKTFISFLFLKTFVKSLMWQILICIRAMLEYSVSY